MNMATNDPQNLDPFWNSSQFQRSQANNKFHQQLSTEFHREFKTPRFTETISNLSSRMFNSSSSSSWPLRRNDEPCQQFKKGWCNYGEMCRFSHSEGQLYPSHGGATKPPARVCKFYLNGQICPYGRNCVFLHQGFSRGCSSKEPRESYAVDASRVWKTRLCQKWDKDGTCPFGPRCRYAHGRSDLHVPHCSSYQEGHGMLSKVEPVKHEPENAAPAKKAVTSSLAAAAAKKVVASLDQPTKKLRRLADFDSSVNINGIYGDWIDFTPDSK